jgi:hypothetical protein
LAVVIFTPEAKFPAVTPEAATEVAVAAFPVTSEGWAQVAFPEASVERTKLGEEHPVGADAKAVAVAALPVTFEGWAQVAFPLAAMERTKLGVVQPLGVAASAVAVVALPESAPEIALALIVVAVRVVALTVALRPSTWAAQVPAEEELAATQRSPERYCVAVPAAVERMVPV